MKKPNVILISIDTLRADHLSCYGYERQTTPNIDRIADQGMLFKNAYSTAVWTPPAHASMLTGLYPCQHRVIHENMLNENIPTIAKILKQNGYQTAGFVNNSQVGELVGFQRAHDDFFEVWRGNSSKEIFKRLSYKIRDWAGYTDFGARRTNLMVYKWLCKRWNPDKPYYLFIHYNEVHNPLRAPKPFLFQYLEKDLLRQVDMKKIWKVAHNPLNCFVDDLKLNEVEIEALTCLYDEEIHYLDHKIGQLFAWLKNRHLLEDTVFVITADHGEHLGEHGLYSHVASLYEPIVHIPLILYHNELLKSVTEVESLVQSVDIMPTILEAANIHSKPDDCLGLSLLTRNKNVDDRFIVAESEGRIPHFVRSNISTSENGKVQEFMSQKLTMIRDGLYKLIISSNGSFELFNLASDCFEKTNLGDKEPDVVNILKKKLEDTMASIKKDTEIQSYDIPPEMRSHLRSLGYL